MKERGANKTTKKYTMRKQTIVRISVSGIILSIVAALVAFMLPSKRNVKIPSVVLNGNCKFIDTDSYLFTCTVARSGAVQTCDKTNIGALPTPWYLTVCGPLCTTATDGLPPDGEGC